MLQPGTRLGGLRIDALIGRGAMGEVYRGEQVELRRPVAIKRIAPHLAQEPEIIARFQREARVVAKIQHGNIVGIYDFSRIADQLGVEHSLLVMEWVEGGCNLSQLIKGHARLSWRDAGAMIRDLAAGLAAAHAVDIVHRDIKPANVLVDATGRAKLADFGLATAADVTSMTMDGAIIGTPNYLSPEACMGQPVGKAGDLYSLGATWYHLLTGEPPFTADSTVALLRAHCDAPIPPVPATEPPMPPAMAALLQACLAKDPTQRPGSAGILAEALAGMDLPADVLDLLPEASDEMDATRISSTADTQAATPATMIASGDLSATLPTEAPLEQTIPTPAAATSGPPVASSPGRGHAGFVIGGIIAVVLIVVVVVVSLRDPLAGQARQVDEALAAGDLGRALTTAAAIVAAHPDRSEGHDLVRKVIDAEVAALITEARFTEALDTVATRRVDHNWLRIDAWDKVIRLAEAECVHGRGGIGKAEDLHLALHNDYPNDLELRHAYLAIFGRADDRQASHRSLGAALDIAESHAGALPALVGDTLLQHLRKHGTYDRYGQPIRDLVLEKYREQTVADALVHLISEEGSDAIGAFKTLGQAGVLTPAQELRHHVRFLASGRYSDQFKESLAWIEEQVLAKDWADRRDAAGLKPFGPGAFAMLAKTNDDAVRVRQLAMAHLREQTIPHLQNIISDAEADTMARWHAWTMLAEAGVEPVIDVLLFHAGSVAAPHPLWQQKPVMAGLTYLASVVNGDRRDEALAALQVGADYLDRVISFQETQPRGKDMAAGARRLKELYIRARAGLPPPE